MFELEFEEMESAISPEQELWRAVLMQAWRDRFDPFWAKQEAGTAKTEAVMFFESLSPAVINTFERVCWFAGVDPDKVEEQYRKSKLEEEACLMITQQ